MSKPTILAQIQSAKQNLENIQVKINSNQNCETLQEDEKEAKITLSRLLQLEESMLKQKAREKSLNLGDSNSRYFYSLVNFRKKRATISSIQDSDGLFIPILNILKISLLTTSKAFWHQLISDLLLNLTSPTLLLVASSMEKMLPKFASLLESPKLKSPLRALALVNHRGRMDSMLIFSKYVGK